MLGNQVSIIDALRVSAISMVLVFLALALISLMLSSFKYIFYKEKNTVVKKSSPKIAEDITDEDDEEDKVVVALAASIMAGQGKLNPNLHISRITRIQ